MCGDSQGTTKSRGRGKLAREQRGPSKRTDRRYSPSPGEVAHGAGPCLQLCLPLWCRPLPRCFTAATLASGLPHSSSRGPLHTPSLCPRPPRPGSLSSLILSLGTFVVSFGCNFTFLCGSLINTCFLHKITAPRAQGLCLFSLRTVCSAPNRHGQITDPQSVFAE